MNAMLFAALVGLVLAPVPALAQAAGVDWQQVQRLQAGSEVVVTLSDGTYAKGRILFAGDAALLTLKRTDRKLPGGVERVLFDVGASWPALLEGRHETTREQVRLSGQGVFHRGRKLADLAEVVLQTPRARIVAVSLGTGPVAASSFDSLAKKLKRGDTVSVIDRQAQEITGRVLTIDADSLILSRAPQTRIAAADIAVIQHRTKAAGRGARWGALLGAVVGGALVAASQGQCSSDCTGGAWAVGAGLGAGLGAGVGAIVGGSLPAGRREVYRAPGSRPPSGTFSLSPVITPDRKEVRLSVAF